MLNHGLLINCNNNKKKQGKIGSTKDNTNNRNTQKHYVLSNTNLASLI
jgi:hypothetical protein